MVAKSTLEIVINGVTTGADRAFDKIGKALSTLGKVAIAGAAAGLAAVGAGLALSIKEAMEAQEVQAQLAAVLKSTGGAAGVTADMANDLATRLAGVTRFGDEAILSGENLLLTFTNIGKDVFPDATQAILDMSQAMGQDIKSSAIQLGKALNDPIEGMSALQRVGVTFTEEQKKAVAAMVATGDVAGAQKLILAELEKEFGGSAVAAGQTFAGQLDILKNSLLNVAEGIGTKILPIITPFVSGLVNLTQAALDAGIGSIEFKEALSGLIGDEGAAAVMDALDKLAKTWSDVLLPAITNVWQWMTTVLLPFLTDVVYPWLATNIPKALQFLSDVWTNVLQPAIAAVWNWLSTVLMPFLQNTVFPWLQTNIPKALKFLSDVWTNVLKPAIDAVWKWMSTVLIPFLRDTVYPWLQEKVPAAIQTLTNFWETVLLPAITTIWEFLKTNVIPIFEDLWELLKVAGELATVAISKLWEETLKPALETVWKFVEEKVIPILSDLWEWFNDKIAPVIQTLVDGALKNLTDGFKAVRDAIQWVIDKVLALIEKLKGLKVPPILERHSPSQFEMSFIGAADAIERLTKVSLPSLRAAMQLPVMGLAGGGVSSSTVNNFNVSLSGSGIPAQDLTSTVRLLELLYG